jgi:hypothetical protein
VKKSAEIPALKRHRLLRVKSRAALAKRYGVNLRSIHNWLKEGAPRRRAGYYNLKDWDAWVEKYKSAESGKENTLAAVQLALKQEDLLEKRRLRSEYERKMVDGETMRKQGVAAAKQITAILTRIPPQIGSILGVEAQRRAQVVVEEALNVLKENPLGEIPA